MICRWPLQLSLNPTAPAVNDFRYKLTFDAVWFLWIKLMLTNPILVLLAVRPAVCRIGVARGSGDTTN